jgi:hypothetical protein
VLKPFLHSDQTRLNCLLDKRHFSYTTKIILYYDYYYLKNTIDGENVALSSNVLWALDLKWKESPKLPETEVGGLQMSTKGPNMGRRAAGAGADLKLEVSASYIN